MNAALLVVVLVVVLLVSRGGGFGGPVDVKMAGDPNSQPTGGGASLAGSLGALACAAGGAYAGGPAGAKAGTMAAPLCASVGKALAEVGPAGVRAAPGQIVRIVTHPTEVGSQIKNTVMGIFSGGGGGDKPFGQSMFERFAPQVKK